MSFSACFDAELFEFPVTRKETPEKEHRNIFVETHNQQVCHNITVSQRPWVQGKYHFIFIESQIITLFRQYSRYFTLYFRRHIQVFLQPSSRRYISRGYTSYIYFYDRINLCILPCRPKRYCDRRHRLASLKLIMYNKQILFI